MQLVLIWAYRHYGRMKYGVGPGRVITVRGLYLRYIRNWRHPDSGALSLFTKQLSLLCSYCAWALQTPESSQEHKENKKGNCKRK